MVDHLETPGVQEGSFGIGMGLPDPWPPTAAVTAYEQRLNGGSITLSFDVDARMTFVLVEDKGSKVEDGIEAREYLLLDKRTLPPISAAAEQVVNLSVRWKDRRLSSIRLNGIERIDASGIILLENNLRVGPAYDFSKANLEARAIRRSKLADRLPKPGRIAGGEQYMFDSLKDEVQQIDELIGTLKLGKEHVVPGLAARLRLLFAGSPLGLLQTCAAHLDASLTLYTNSDPYALPPMQEGVWFFLSGAGDRNAVHHNPVDLDVWLQIPALRLSATDYSAFSMLKNIGDTLGAHRDPDITEVMSALMKTPGVIRRYHDVATALFIFSDVATALGQKMLALRADRKGAGG